MKHVSNDHWNEIALSIADHFEPLFRHAFVGPAHAYQVAALEACRGRYDDVDHIYNDAETIGG